MGSNTKGDWINMATLGLANDPDTRARRDADERIAKAKAEAAKPKVNLTGATSSLGDTGGSSVDNIVSETDKKKKIKKRIGTSSAQIPTTGIANKSKIGLGGI